jgi:Family of unknown function (DUF5908)
LNCNTTVLQNRFQLKKEGAFLPPHYFSHFYNKIRNMVEVKELVIRANVSEKPANATNGETTNTNTTSNNSTDDALIEACVRQVLAILERQKER